MSRFWRKEHRRFFVALAALALIAAVEAEWLRRRMETAGGARERLARLEREWQAGLPVDEGAANERVEERARLTRELARLQSEETKMPETDAASLPGNRAEAFFALAQFVEAMRERAADRGVAIAADERFGFAEYAHTGPAAEDIARVFRERQIAESLLTALFDARPMRLVGLTRPAEAPEPEGRVAFHLAFEGRTETLRSLLNRLADESFPAEVRAVEAQRVDARDTWQGGDGNDGAELLVPNRDSRFTVEVEWLGSGVAAGRSEAVAREPTAEMWTPPMAQRRGDAWVFDVFAPPEVFYEANAERFSVMTPAPLPVAIASPLVAETFALELVEVRHAAFRLQLIGFAGDEGAYRGLFENAETGETFVAMAGYDVPGLDVRIEQFAVERRAVPLAESMTTWRRVAMARVRDGRSGEEVLLSSLERRLASEPAAVVMLRGTAQRREVREGDAVEVGEAVYRVRRIQTAPPALELSCESEGSAESERRTLTARRDEAPEPAPTS